MTTVGGKDEGRPRVVVPNGGAPAADAGVDRPEQGGHGGHNNAQQENKPHTSIVEGKPEPGHDVFAAPEDAKSVSVVVEKEEGGEQKETTKKEISTVGVAGPAGVHVVVGTEKSEKEEPKTVVQEEKEKEKDAVVAEGEQKVVQDVHGEDKKPDAETTAASTAVTTATEVKANAKPAGPLNEAEQEAERVAQELFPES